ncbi:MAG: pyrimidine reductase family protein [Acidimicrobiales bacterium]|nr:pyrimidine reductase family protein [Acidimicrobiales bacterium]
MLNVIASVDGSTVVDGVSGPLGTPADKLVFSALRASADVILAGSATVTAENYRPPRTSAVQQELRTARGQRHKPRIAVVSGSLRFSLDAELFSEPAERPIVVTTTDADPRRLAAVRERADVVTAGNAGTVDLRRALAELRAEGSLVLCEGGSALNGYLVGDDLVDEVNLSVAAVLAGGNGPRLAAGGADVLHGLSLAHLWESDGMLMARYVTDR